MENKLVSLIVIAFLLGITVLEAYHLLTPDGRFVGFSWWWAGPALLFAVSVVFSIREAVADGAVEIGAKAVFLGAPLGGFIAVIISALTEPSELEEMAASLFGSELREAVGRHLSTVLRHRGAAYLFAAAAGFCAVAAVGSKETKPWSRRITRIGLTIGVMMALNLFFVRHPVDRGWTFLLKGADWERDIGLMGIYLPSWAFVLSIFSVVALPAVFRLTTGVTTRQKSGWLLGPSLICCGMFALANLLVLKTSADILYSHDAGSPFVAAAFFSQWMPVFQPKLLAISGVLFFGLYLWPERQNPRRWAMPVGLLVVFGSGSVIAMEFADHRRSKTFAENRSCVAATMMMNLAGRDVTYQPDYYGVSEADSLSARFDLPAIHGDVALPDAVRVGVLKTSIIVNDMKIAHLQNGTIDESLLLGPTGHIVAPLRDALQEPYQHQKMIAARVGERVKSELVFLMDPGASTRLMRRVIFTAHKVGFSNMYFAVRPPPKKGSLCQRLAAIPAPPLSVTFDNNYLNTPYLELLSAGR